MDSTHIQAGVRYLNRLECVGETLRYALNSMAELAPHRLNQWEPSEWYERYEVRFCELDGPGFTGDNSHIGICSLTLFVNN